MQQSVSVYKGDRCSWTVLAVPMLLVVVYKRP